MEKKSLIKQLQEKLYSRTANEVSPMIEHKLPERRTDYTEVPGEWSEKPASQKLLKPELVFEEEKPRAGGTFWLLLISIVFFVGAVSYAAYSLLRGSASVSPENISVLISGPVSTPGGEKLSLDVSITNKNKAMLRTTELLIEYPAGTRRADDGSKELLNERIYLGDIEPGQTERQNINAVLFGEEQTAADIKMSLEYRIPNSNTIFSKDVPYQIIISSNPLSLSVDAPHETISGENLTISVTVRSNAAETIRNVLLEGQFPAGFAFKESSLKPVSGERVWRLGDLPPGESRLVTIIGVLSGENKDSRTFRFQSGVGSSRNEDVIETPFAGFKSEVAIRKPFIGISISVNGERGGDVSVPSGKQARLEVFYANNLSVPVRNVSISLLLGGAGLNERSIKVERGFYQSNIDTVRWDKGSVPELAEVAPGEGGTVGFTIEPETSLSASNPDITISGAVAGERSEESGVPEEVRAAAFQRILLQSEVTFSARASYYTGSFKNSGGLPPKAERETTYTIIWSLSNSTNDISNAKISAALPPFIRFTGEVSPASEKVSFNEVERRVVWDVGVLRAGTGFSKSAREVSFKIGLTPSVSQVGETPLILGQASFSGEDSFTKTRVNFSGEEITTRLSEGEIKGGEETVIP